MLLSHSLMSPGALDCTGGDPQAILSSVELLEVIPVPVLIWVIHDYCQSFRLDLPIE